MTAGTGGAAATQVTACKVAPCTSGGGVCERDPGEVAAEAAAAASGPDSCATGSATEALAVAEGPLELEAIEEATRDGDAAEATADVAVGAASATLLGAAAAPGNVTCFLSLIYE